jgi:hypothetical protein
VKFLDGGHQWNKTRTLASPAAYTGPDDTGRILIHAGDVTTHGSFDRFRETLPAYPLVVSADKVDYRFGDRKEHIEMFRYDLAARGSFSLPRINGAPIDLHPEAVYQSPFLRGFSNSDRIHVSIGPVRQVLDFASIPTKE